MIIDEKDYLEHYGVLRKSGRYPWGSGGTQIERSRTFLGMVDDLHKQGLSDKEIVKALNLDSTTQLRSTKSIAKNEVKQAEINMAVRLKDKGMSNIEIGKRMGKPESSVRALLKSATQDKANILINTADMLQAQVDQRGLIDIGKGNEYHIGVSSNTLSNAVAVLKEKGYEVHTIPVDQLGTGKKTNVKVLAPPGTTWGDVKRNQNNIQLINAHTDDGGRTDFTLIKPPISINPKRVQVVWAEDGGTAADGVLFVRPGVEDLHLGGSHYAQVRVSVGKEHYLKGMAVYKDDLPDGVDIQFHTNKPKSDDKLKAMKPIQRNQDGSIDMNNPYGSTIARQITDASGKKVTSAMNIVNEEGNWTTWSKSLSSQMLSKQSPTLAKQQLDLSYKQKVEEFERISELTNPTVRKKLLEDFGDGVDSSAVKLDAAAIPRTHGHHVLLPVSSMPPTHVYAPNYRDGERVVLIRHPHGGPFEIPELVVDNNHPEAKKLIGQARAAIGIHHSVAERLSGADFDGDTVLVIPNNSGKVKTTAALEGLKGFDTQRAYPAYPGMKKITPSHKQTLMGEVTNLITDMTIKGASTAELARAIRHSMVVIDSEKHNLNYRQSAIDNNITQLKEKYQGTKRGGSATLISRAGSKVPIPKRAEARTSEGGPIDKTTGKRVYRPVGTGYTNPKTGVFTPHTEKVRRLSIVDDAHELVSSPPGTRIERIYADHSNKLKALANKSRKASVNTPKLVRSPSAAVTYKEQVKSLNNKLDLALRNAPLERQAQIIGNAKYHQILDANPDMDDARKKKVKFQAMAEARNIMGAERHKIEISQDEWNAIQAGAISNNKLENILDNADMEIVRKLATPRTQRLMSTAKISQAKALLKAGYTRAEVADHLGVSLTTLDTATNG